MTDKKCPNCKLWNSETAMICDCGYEFSSGAVRRDWPYSRPTKRKLPLGRATFAWGLASLLAAIVFAVILFHEYPLLWISVGTFFTLTTARELWLGHRYRNLLPPDSPTTQARIVARRTRKVMGEYGPEIIHQVVIRFHPKQARGAPEALTLSAQVNSRRYSSLMHAESVSIRYSREDPCIVLMADEK